MSCYVMNDESLSVIARAFQKWGVPFFKDGEVLDPQGIGEVLLGELRIGKKQSLETLKEQSLETLKDTQLKIAKKQSLETLKDTQLKIAKKQSLETLKEQSLETLKEQSLETLHETQGEFTYIKEVEEFEKHEDWLGIVYGAILSYEYEYRRNFVLHKDLCSIQWELRVLKERLLEESMKKLGYGRAGKEVWGIWNGKVYGRCMEGD